METRAGSYPAGGNLVNPDIKSTKCRQVTGFYPNGLPELIGLSCPEQIILTLIGSDPLGNSEL
jgi:hypothetical protein